MESFVSLLRAMGWMAILSIVVIVALLNWDARQPIPPKGTGKFIHIDRGGRCEYMFENGETGAYDFRPECPAVIRSRGKE